MFAKMKCAATNDRKAVKQPKEGEEEKNAK